MYGNLFNFNLALGREQNLYQNIKLHENAYRILNTYITD